MTRVTRRRLLNAAPGAAVLVDNSAVALFLGTYSPAPLEQPPPFTRALPPASQPPEMMALQVETR
jgi:hypothetical protein